VGTSGDHKEDGTSGSGTVKVERDSSSPQISVKKPVLPPSTSKPNLDILANTSQQQCSSNIKSPPAPPPKPSKEVDSSEEKKTINSLDATIEPVTEVKQAGSLNETTTESVPDVKKISLKETKGEQANKAANTSEGAKESLGEAKKECPKEVAKEPMDHPDGDISVLITQPTMLIGNPPVTRPKPPAKHPKPKTSVPNLEGKAVTPEIACKNIESKETAAVAKPDVVKEIPEEATEKTIQKMSTGLEKTVEKVSEEDKSIAEKTTEKIKENDVITSNDMSTEKSVAPKPKPKPKMAEKDLAKASDVDIAPQIPSPTTADDVNAVAPKPRPKPRSSTKTLFDTPKDEEEVAGGKEEQDIPVVVSYTPDSDSVKEGEFSVSPNRNGTDELTANMEDTKDDGIPLPIPPNDKKIIGDDNNVLKKSEALKEDKQDNIVTPNGNTEVNIVDDNGDGLYSVVTLNRRSEEREESPIVESTNQQKPTRTHHYDSVSLSPRPSPSPDLEEPEYDVIGIRNKSQSTKQSEYDNWKLKKLPPKQSSTVEEDDSYAVIDNVSTGSVNIPNDAMSSETQQVSVTSPVPLSVAASTIPQYAQVCKITKKKKSTSPDGGPQTEDNNFDLLYEELGSSVPDHLNQAKEILRLAQVVRQEAEQMKKEAAEDREIARKERIDAEMLKKNATEILKQAKEKAAAS